MTIQSFIWKMKDMLAAEDSSVIVEWIEFAGNISSICENNLEDELEETLRALYYVKNNFCPEVLQKSLHYISLSNEIINAAFCFCRGYTANEINEFAADGKLECGYIPEREDEIGSFSIIRNVGSEVLFIAINEPKESVEKQMRRLSILSENEEVSIAHLLNDKTINNMQIQAVNNSLLADAMCYAFTHSLAIRSFCDFSPTEYSMEEISQPLLDVIEFEKKSDTTDKENTVRVSETVQERLMAKIADNLTGYETNWLFLSYWELLDRAEEISVIRMLAKVLPEIVTNEQAGYLLQFKNPLEVVGDKWMNVNSYESSVLADEIERTLWQIVDKKDTESLYDMENPAENELAGFSMSM